MPLNADVAYFIAREKYEKARTTAEKIAALEELISASPTHKGAEKMRAQLKRKLAELKAARAAESRKKGGGTGSVYSIRKTGTAQAVLIGYPGAGKSSVLAAVTNARPEISRIPYTTKVPHIGNLKFSNMDFQIVEAPAIVPGAFASGKAGELFGLVRNAELIVAVLDSRSSAEQYAGLMSELRAAGIRGRILVIANKQDIARDIHLESCPYRIIRASAALREGLAGLGEEIWQSLGKIRIYTRKGAHTDERPMVMAADSTVRDAMNLVHKSLAETFRFARVWRTRSQYSGSRVGLDFRLADGDTVEIFA